MEKKSKKPSKFDRWFENRGFKVAFGLVGLGLAYVFASLAIDTGSLLDYAITLLLLFVSVRELAAAVFRKKHDRQ